MVLPCRLSARPQPPFSEQGTLHERPLFSCPSGPSLASVLSFSLRLTRSSLLSNRVCSRHPMSHITARSPSAMSLERWCPVSVVNSGLYNFSMFPHPCANYGPPCQSALHKFMVSGMCPKPCVEVRPRCLFPLLVPPRRSALQTLFLVFLTAVSTNLEVCDRGGPWHSFRIVVLPVGFQHDFTQPVSTVFISVLLAFIRVSQLPQPS